MKPQPIETSFWNKVELIPFHTCWEWVGEICWTGYGRLTASGRRILAHRLSYELFKGNIPDGLVIDHLCRNRSCVNPNHLEAVTQSVNVRRGLAPQIGGKASGEVQKAKKCCPKGHPYDDVNTYITPNDKRDCKECRRAACRRHYWRGKAA